MKFKIITLFLSLIHTFNSIGQTTGIVIDENFSDWKSSMETYNDSIENPTNVDLVSFQVTNNQDYLFVKLVLNKEISLSSNYVPHDIWMYIDADNDPTTGYNLHSGYGTELSISFKEHYGYFNVPTPGVQYKFVDLKLNIAPTVTSDTFELSIPLDTKPNGIDPLFSGDTIRIVFKEKNNGDFMPDLGEVFYYVIDSNIQDSIELTGFNKTDSNQIRIINYNVLLNSGWNGSSKLTNLESVVKALKGDIYAFSESNNTTIADAKTYFDSWMPLGTTSGWHVQKQSDMITCSKWPITQTWNLTNQLVTLIDLPNSYPNDILLTNAHLTWNSDAARQAQVDEYTAFLLDAKQTGGSVNIANNTAVVYTGDLNFRRSNQQLQTLLNGDIQDTSTYGTGALPDWDSSPMTDAVPRHSDHRMVHTWRTHNIPSHDDAPLRIDLQIYSDNILNLHKAFVLQTEIMDSSRLSQIGLDSADTWMISDHLPVIADYSFKSSTLTVEPNASQLHDIIIYPNPTVNEFAVLTNRHVKNISLYDMSGRKIKIRSLGGNRYSFDSNITGIYTLHIEINGTTISKKIVKY